MHYTINMKTLPHSLPPTYHLKDGNIASLPAHAQLVVFVDAHDLQTSLAGFSETTQVFLQSVLADYPQLALTTPVISLPRPVDTSLQALHLVLVAKSSKVSALTKRLVKLAKLLSNQPVAEYFIAGLAQLTRPQLSAHQTQILTALADGLYQFKVFKSNAKETLAKRINLLDPLPFECDLQQLNALVAGQYWCRDLANLPANICTPFYLANQGAVLAQQHQHIECEMYDANAICELGMGAYSAVGQGSANPAHMAVVHYRHPSATNKPVVLVGKGVTFDAGGITLKAGAGMGHMTYDMAGAAAIIGVMHTLALQQLPVNVIAIVAAVENLPDGNAYRPGDILTTLSGQTVEVISTDAEGRLVLADALTFAQRFDPLVMVDIATLTGAAIQSLGHIGHLLLTNSSSLSAQLLDAAAQSGDKTWQMPLWDEYQTAIDSPFADMKNSGTNSPGAITAGCFLSRFVGDTPWAHLDVAGTAFHYGRGNSATARPIPLLIKYLENLSVKLTAG